MQSIAKMANSRPRLRGIVNYLPQLLTTTVLGRVATASRSLQNKCSVAFLIVSVLHHRDKSYNENPTVFNLPKIYLAIHLLNLCVILVDFAAYAQE
jgi:hypothetical protein